MNKKKWAQPTSSSHSINFINFIIMSKLLKEKFNFKYFLNNQVVHFYR